MPLLLDSGARCLEFAEYIGATAIVISIFLATAVFIWQSGRSDAKIDRLDSRIDRLDAKIEAQGDRIDARIDRLEAKIEENGKRVSDAELEQARLNGVNSVLVNYIHTHDRGD